MKHKIIMIDAKQIAGLSTGKKIKVGEKCTELDRVTKQYKLRGVSAIIQNRVRPGTTYGIYHNYTLNGKGDFNYFVGEEISSLDGQEQMRIQSLVIQPGIYKKFTTRAGNLPTVVNEVWEAIANMEMSTLKNKRLYQTDFEVYDQRARNPSNAVVDIYIGIKS